MLHVGRRPSLVRWRPLRCVSLRRAFPPLEILVIGTGLLQPLGKIWPAGHARLATPIILLKHVELGSPSETLNRVESNLEKLQFGLKNQSCPFYSGCLFDIGNLREHFGPNAL